MEKQKFCSAEERQLNWFINFKLPNYWKKIGLGLFIIPILMFIAIKFMDNDFMVLKNVLRKIILVGLLIITISKEKIEDEFIESLRSRAFSFAFVIGAVYVLIMPIINYLVFSLIKPSKANFEDLGDFQVLWFLFFFYLVVFEMLKRKHR